MRDGAGSVAQSLIGETILWRMRGLTGPLLLYVAVVFGVACWPWFLSHYLFVRVTGMQPGHPLWHACRAREAAGTY